MSESIIDEIPSSLNGIISETDQIMDNITVPSIDEITAQEIDMREQPTTLLIGNQLDDDDSDDSDDGIQVTIRNYEPETSTFQINRQKNRTMLTTSPMMPPKVTTTRGIDLDAQGFINGQQTYEHDIMNAYKDEEKPWKKPGADITDYFNYGFTEETWAQYCDRQRRLRAENNLARNVTHIPPMPPMISNHPQMIHPMNPHPMMMINKPLNMQMIPRPMNVRKPDGRIGVIGTTDQTSRRPVFETPNSFEHPSYINGSPFPGGQPSNGQTVGDLISTPPASANGHPPSHETPPAGGTHPISTLGTRLTMMSLPPGMQFRPQFGHPLGPGGPQFFPRGPLPGMHGDRPPQPYFIPRHPQQQWDPTGVPPVHGFPPGTFPPQNPPSAMANNSRAPSSRSQTPENHSSRSSTPEENRPNTNISGENEKSSKDDRYKERYRDDRDHSSSSRRRTSPKDRSSSSYRSHHRGSEHEYERPRNDRKSSRDRDDKYERYSRKRHHKEDTSRHHRTDDESSRSRHSSHRTPTKTNLNESSQTSIEQPESINSEFDQPISSLSRDESERSSSRHSHHKKSSRRSRHDSGDERSGSHHHRRRSKEHSSSNNKRSTNQNESSSDVKEQINE